jgi:Zinc-binding dehydrogenase
VCDTKDVERVRSLGARSCTTCRSSFRPVIDRTYPLEEVVEAPRYVETGLKTGSVVLRARGGCVRRAV